ncbi:hypothetical protein ABJI51_34705 [Amycolatopsis sp. NEAU-NG30]|uniref:Uncharacterized protein n=1 Tax=Amycolatopsis melonis TaxID=3156488 RepID=A0ABV0LPN3_9PSEU
MTGMVWVPAAGCWLTTPMVRSTPARLFPGKRYAAAEDVRPIRDEIDRRELLAGLRGLLSAPLVTMSAAAPAALTGSYSTAFLVLGALTAAAGPVSLAAGPASSASKA